MKNLSLLLVASFFIFSCGQKPAEESKESETTVEKEEVATTPGGVFFVFPNDGDTVSSPVKVGFGVNGMEVEPAGQVNEGMGHHHIIVDGEFVAEGVIVPADSAHIHYGKGQKEASLNLLPGKHTLTMQFADGVHTSYGEAWSKTIEITISEPEVE